MILKIQIYPFFKIRCVTGDKPKLPQLNKVSIFKSQIDKIFFK